MKLTTAVGITVIAGAVLSGFAAVGSYAMGELDKKVNIVHLNKLIDTFEKARAEKEAADKKKSIRDYKREQRGYTMKPIKDPIDVWKIGDLQDHIDELELELQLTQ